MAFLTTLSTYHVNGSTLFSGMFIAACIAFLSAIGFVIGITFAIGLVIGIFAIGLVGIVCLVIRFRFPVFCFPPLVVRARSVA